MGVYVVGAGPGDPDLVTVRGLELIRGCDVLVFDRLVADELVLESPDDSLRIPRERLSQEAINDLLVDYGRKGLEVVRLKGGDPFLFGRGGEEALALAAAGVRFEVVPGVSALSAVPAAAGIPVTHRGIASHVTAVSAHSPALDYEWLAEAPGTLVFFMGLANIELIVSRLIRHGKDPSTPAAIVANGWRPNQQVVVAPLDELPAAAESIETPALIVVGETVAIAELLRSGGLVAAAVGG